MRQKFTVLATVVAIVLLFSACGTPARTLPPQPTPSSGPGFAPLPAALFPTFELSRAAECRAQKDGETLYILPASELAVVISAIAGLQVGQAAEPDAEYIEYIFLAPNRSWSVTVGDSTVMMPDGPHVLFGVEGFQYAIQAARMFSGN